MAYSVDDILKELRDIPGADRLPKDPFDMGRIDDLVSDIMKEVGSKTSSEDLHDVESGDKQIESTESAPKTPAKKYKRVTSEHMLNGRDKSSSDKVKNVFVHLSSDEQAIDGEKEMSDDFEKELRDFGLDVDTDFNIDIDEIREASSVSSGNFSADTEESYEQPKSRKELRKEKREQKREARQAKKVKSDIIEESFAQEHISEDESSNSFNFDSLEALFEDIEDYDLEETLLSAMESDIGDTGDLGDLDLEALDDYETDLDTPYPVSEAPIEEEEPLADDYDDYEEKEDEEKRKPHKVKKIRKLRNRKAVRVVEHSEEFADEPNGEEEDDVTGFEDETYVPKHAFKATVHLSQTKAEPAEVTESEDSHAEKEPAVSSRMYEQDKTRYFFKGKESADVPEHSQAEKTEPVQEKAEEPKSDYEQFEKEQAEFLANLRKRYGLDTQHTTIQGSGEMSEKELNLFGEEQENVHEDAIERFFTLTRKVGDTLVKHAKKADLERERISEDIDMEGQIRIEGFDRPGEDSAVQMSEEELKRELVKNREIKIREFEAKNVLKSDTYEEVDETSDDIEEESEERFEEIVDYNSRADERAIYVELRSAKRRMHNKCIAMGIIEFALIIVNILGSGMGKMGGAISSFGLDSSPVAYVITNLVLFTALIAMNLSTLSSGFAGLFKGRPNSDSVISLACVLTVAQSAYTVWSVQTSGPVSHIYPCVAGFALLLNGLGKSSMHKRIFYNFRCLISNKDKHVVTGVESETEAKEMSRGMDIEIPYLKYTVPVDFATGFLKNSYYLDPADSLALKTAYPIVGVCAVAGVLAGLITQSVLFGLSVSTAGMLICASMGDVLAFNRPFERLNRKLNITKTFISGFGTVDELALADCVVLDSRDLFPSGTCNLRGIKTFNGMSVSDAIIYMTAVLRTTDSPLNDLFMRVVEGKTDFLPPVEGTAYEERMGVSAWLYDKKMLVGSKELLESHGVEIPRKSNPYDYIIGNQRVVFLAIDGKAVAMFIVSYAADRRIRTSLQKLERTGVSILVKTPDANLDEKFLSKIFSLGPNTIRIMSGIAVGIYDKLINESAPKLNAGLVTGGRMRSFINAVAGCVNIFTLIQTLSVIELIGMILGVLVITVCGCCGALANIGSVAILIYCMFWTVVQAVISGLRKI